MPELQWKVKKIIKEGEWGREGGKAEEGEGGGKNTTHVACWILDILNVLFILGPEFILPAVKTKPLKTALDTSPLLLSNLHIHAPEFFP